MPGIEVTPRAQFCISRGENLLWCKHMKALKSKFDQIHALCRNSDLKQFCGIKLPLAFLKGKKPLNFYI